MLYIKRVYINYLFTTMQKEFVTGLKLKNSLSNKLVTLYKNSVNIHSDGWKERQVVHMWTHSILEQSHGSCQVFNHHTIEIISAMI